MNKIMCISLWQPWASLIAVGAKRIETRSWSTPYRGLIGIHAAKRKNIGELLSFGCQYDFSHALKPLIMESGSRKTLDEVLPFGALVAVAELAECRPTATFTVGELDIPLTWEKNPTDYNCWRERSFGDYSPGRYGWVLRNIRKLPEPIPMRGQQGLWWIDMPEALRES